MRRPSLFILMFLVLSACGSGGGGLTASVVDTARGVLAPGEAPQDLRKTLTPDILAQLPGSVMLIELPEREAQAGVLRVTANGPNVTWAGQDGTTVAFRAGILTATRGLGGDLMSADLDQVVAAVYGDNGPSVRVHRYLDGEEQIFPRSLVCRYSRTQRQHVAILGREFLANLVRETCRTTDLEVTNLYWLDTTGVIRKSKQWVGPQVGYMLTELLKG